MHLKALKDILWIDEMCTQFWVVGKGRKKTFLDEWESNQECAVKLMQAGFSGDRRRRLIQRLDTQSRGSFDRDLDRSLQAANRDMAWNRESEWTETSPLGKKNKLP